MKVRPLPLAHLPARRGRWPPLVAVTTSFLIFLLATTASAAASASAVHEVHVAQQGYQGQQAPADDSSSLESGNAEKLLEDNELLKQLAEQDEKAVQQRKENFQAESHVQEELIGFYAKSLQAQRLALDQLQSSSKQNAEEAVEINKELKKTLDNLKKSEAGLVAAAKEKAKEAVVQKFREENFLLKNWDKVTFGTENSKVAERKTEQYVAHVNDLYTRALQNERQAAGLETEANSLAASSQALSDGADDKEEAGEALAAQLDRSEAAQLKLQAGEKRAYADALMAEAKQWTGKRKDLSPGTDGDVDELVRKPYADVHSSLDFLARR
ncbi:unnamed protein product [Amoebophrya sp. A120]|nr:unnamed protein product [Amoebophrya sp. A120]|eukprot:GSA120T00009156001.1